ncbi:hypothetical protein K9L67_01035 [Candidatus Woesearchaeota archaeon]|nr:hypothetical protein [Candidatus Woesearchaeota archaeon]MCF7900788.1 hypothetical protein [Candidatus Woesearchaeota archaeon]MCF8013090.1 hypothetical protein [Candidatus Woesearchaeota archaeon]
MVNMLELLKQKYYNKYSAIILNILLILTGVLTRLNIFSIGATITEEHRVLSSIFIGIGVLGLFMYIIFYYLSKQDNFKKDSYFFNNLFLGIGYVGSGAFIYLFHPEIVLVALLLIVHYIYTSIRNERNPKHKEYTKPKKTILYSLLIIVIISAAFFFFKIDMSAYFFTGVILITITSNLINEQK